MNVLDIIILALIGYNAMVGLRQGAVKMISGLIAVILATFVSKFIYAISYNAVGVLLPFCKQYPLLYYVICFGGVLVAVQFVAQLIHTLFQWTGVGFINHIGGCLLGGIRGVFFALILALPLTAMGSHLATESLIVHDLEPFVMDLIRWIDESNLASKLAKEVL